MGKPQQAKGKRGEEELRDLLCAKGYQVQRGCSQNYGTVPDLYGLPGVHCEVKRQEHLQLNAAMEQAQKDSERFHDGFPAVFHRASRQKWKVTMFLDDWLQIYEGRREP